MAILTDAERSRVCDAIGRAERQTSGEIYCVMAASSDSYFFPAAFALTAALLPLGLVLTMALEHWWYLVDPVILASAQIVSWLLALALLWVFPDLCIRLTPSPIRWRRAHDNAVRQFLARNIHVTEARTGILVFVSLAERYAEIVADAGINSRVDQAEWNDLVEILISRAAQNKPVAGFIDAVDRAGLILAREFPRGDGDRNELGDHLVEI